MISHIVEHDHLPDYSITTYANYVDFYSKNPQQTQNHDNFNELFIKIETI